jgi:hypothetical protein
VVAPPSHLGLVPYGPGSRSRVPVAATVTEV